MLIFLPSVWAKVLESRTSTTNSPHSVLQRTSNMFDLLIQPDGDDDWPLLCGFVFQDKSAARGRENPVERGEGKI